MCWLWRLSWPVTNTCKSGVFSIKRTGNATLVARIHAHTFIIRQCSVADMNASRIARDTLIFIGVAVVGYAMMRTLNFSDGSLLVAAIGYTGLAAFFIVRG